MNLFQHQTQAVEAMIRAEGFLLADECGLGKTAAVAVAGCHRAAAQGGEEILVICPRNVITHWKNTFAAFCPQYPASKIKVTNYERLKNLSMADVQGVGVLIVDEMHKVKSETSQRFAILYHLWETMNQACAFRGHVLTVYGSTGTPVYSYPIDLMTILLLLKKLRWQDIPTFKARYCNPTRRNMPSRKGALDFRGASNLDELARDCAGFIMRRSWKDAGVKMPALTMTTIEVNEKVTSPEYLAAAEDFKAYYVSTGGKPSGAGMARFTLYRRLLAVAKVPAVIEQALDDLRGGQHTFVLSEFREAATAIYEGLVAEGQPAGLIMGGQTAKARQDIIDSFIAAKGPAVIVATTDSIGEGTDGLQRVCHLVNFVDHDFEPAMFVQALRRLWRWGQKDPVAVRRFVIVGDSMEGFISSNLARKEGYMRALGLEDTTSMNNLLKGKP